MASSVSNRPLAAPRFGKESRGAKRSWGQRASHRLVWLGIILAVLLVACSNTAAPDQPSAEAPPNLAPDVTISLYQGQEALGGDSVNLSDLRGQPVVLNFWAGLCPPCRAEIPDLQRFHEEFEGRAVLLGLDVGQFTGLGTQEEARALLEELGVTYPAGFTTDGSVVSQYRVVAMPTTVFIDAQGEIFRKWSGPLNQEKLAEITNEILDQ